jgi:hypothetical protein
MRFRHLAVWFLGMALFGTTLLRAQPPRQDRPAQLRAEVVRLRTEAEMLRFDYELARDRLLEELKMGRGLRTMGGLIGLGASLQSAMNDASSGVAPRKLSEQERKKAAEATKVAEQEEKKAEVQEASFLAEQKKELSRLFALLAEKRLDLEDAERKYRETAR